jgi:hypothetical protein
MRSRAFPSSGILSSSELCIRRCILAANRPRGLKTSSSEPELEGDGDGVRQDIRVLFEGELLIFGDGMGKCTSSSSSESLPAVAMSAWSFDRGVKNSRIGELPNAIEGEADRRGVVIAGMRK